MFLKRRSSRPEPSSTDRPQGSRSLERRTVSFTACSDLTEYVAAALAYRESAAGEHSSPIPVLCQGAVDEPRALRMTGVESCFVDFEGDGSVSSGMTETELLGLLKDRNEPDAARNSKLVVVDGDDAAVPGYVYALVTGKRMISFSREELYERLEAEAAEDSSLLLVMTTATLDRLSLGEMARAIRNPERAHQSPPWGLIVGRDAATVSRVIARITARRAPRDRSGVVATYLPLSIALEDEDLEYVRDEEELRRFSKRWSEEEARLVIYLAHGLSYCGAGGNLCSRLDEPSSDDDLACINGLVCRNESFPRIPVRSLAIDVVILLSCHSLRLGSVPGGGDPLSVQLLENRATAVFSPHQTGSASPWQPLVTWSLLREGRTLGELMQFHEHLLRDTHNVHDSPYVLLGDPEMKVFEGEQLPIELAVAREGADVWVLDLPPIERGVETYRCLDEGLYRARLGHPLYPLTDDEFVDECVVCSVVDTTRREIRIVVGASPALHGANVRVRLTTRQPLRDWVLPAAGSFMRSLYFDAERHLAAEDFGDEWDPEEVPSLSRRLDELEGAIVSGSRSAMVSPGAYEALHAHETTILDACNSAAEGMLANLEEQAYSSAGLWLYSYLAEVRGYESLEIRRRDDSCASCGGAVYVNRYRIGASRHVDRVFGECETCHLMVDHDESIRELRMECPEVCLPGGSLEVRVHARSTLTSPALLHGTLVVELYRDCFEVDIERLQGEVDPGGEIDVTFRLTHVAPTRVGLQGRLKAIVLLNGRPAMARREFRVVHDSDAVAAAVGEHGGM